MWHQPWSSSSVSTTIVGQRRRAGERPLTVIDGRPRAGRPSRRRAPAFVAAVPPSCETPMTRPAAGGSSDSSNAWLRRRPWRLGRPAAADRLAQDLGDGQRRVLGRAAAGDDDRLAGRRASRERPRRAGRRRRCRSRRAARGSGRRGPARPRSCRSCGTAGRDARLGVPARRPRLGRAGQRSGRVEGRVGRHRSLLLGAEDRCATRRRGARPRDVVCAALPRRFTIARRTTPGGPGDPEVAMQVGLMAPQGWKGEYDGWHAGRGLGADGRARQAGRGARLRVAVGLRPLPHRPATRPTRSRSSRSRCSPRWRWRPSASASATWSSAPGSATRRSRPRWPRRSTSSAAAGSSSASAPAGRKTSGGPTATASRRSASGWHALGDHLEVITGDARPGPGDATRASTPRPRRDQRAEGHPGAAHPDHRRRQRRSG